MPSPGNPSHGDFLRSQSLNRYAYVLNNPLRYTDPTGMFEQSAIEAYLQSLYPDNWQDILKRWMQDEAWWSALLTAGAGDVLASINNGTLHFARFEGEGQKKVTGVSRIADVFGTDKLGEAQLADVYNGSLGLLAAVVTFDASGQMAKAYGLNGFDAAIHTVSSMEAKLFVFMMGIGLTSAYAYIPAATAAQWTVKTVGTAAAGATILPDVRCQLGVCAGDQWLMVNMAGFNPGSKESLSYSYWKYWGEIRYHARESVYQDYLINFGYP